MLALLDYPAMLFWQLFIPKKDATFTVHDTGLKITIPKKFEVLSPKQIERLVKRNEAETKMILQKKPSYPSRCMVFMARHEIHNQMVFTVTNLDELPENEWRNQNDDVYNSLLKMAYYRYKNYKLVNVTTENGARQKDEIVFNTTDIVAATPAREIYRARLYNTVYKNYGLHVTMAFAEENIGEEMLNILRSATFA